MFQILPTGQKLTREIINNIPRHVLSMIRPGPGIRAFPTGDGGICIATDMVTAGQGRQSRGGGAASPANATSLSLGQLVQLDAGGDLIDVHLYDYDADNWSAEVTQIYKPYSLMYSSWNGITVIYTDATTRTYDATDLNIRYQRRATWTEGSTQFTEVQEITEPYSYGELLWILTTPAGDLIDINQAGRAWATNAEDE